MSFYIKKRRTPIIPVVSLIDILTILLLFFIVTTTFKKKKDLNALLKVSLPSATALKPALESTPRVPITVKADSTLFLDGQPVTADTLAPALKAWRELHPTARLELKADEAAPLGTLVKVWDALAAAGLKVNTDVPTKILLKAK